MAPYSLIHHKMHRQSALKMKTNKIFFLIFITVGLIGCGAKQAETSSKNTRPGLILTEQGIARMQAELGNIPLFDSTLQRLQQEVDAEIARSVEHGIDTPIPKDLSGGYTHRRHKANFFMLQKAGVLFQILEDEKYAIYIRDMLFQYEAMYQDLPLHPQTRSYARGKLFWQCLNDSNWLVYAAQAYDAIYHWLSNEQRNALENNLFRPFANHISIDNPQFFNRVHNHSTWGNAAVGMIGLAMGDDELVDRALYGIPFSDIDMDAKDNDGGFIYARDRKAGFLANLDQPFSPDGYYTEGPYYQRYAMYPFLIFAQALQNVKPELNILEHKDGVLLKAVDALLNLTDANGEFFALNDGQKGMSYQNDAVVTALNIAYYYGDQDPQLLDLAQQQGRVLLNDTGYAVAVAIRDGLTQSFTKKSVNYSDGANGDEGGLSLLRYNRSHEHANQDASQAANQNGELKKGESQSDDNNLTLLFKYTAQGLSHGHYDKLSFSLFDQDEILQDYGMSRFVNIGQKGGGNYLPENKSWAKQSIAHNTLVVNQTSHFSGRYEDGSQHHSDLRFFDASNKDVQVVSASEVNAYPGTAMQRTLAMIKDKTLEKPFILDLFRASSKTNNQYDLPYYYMGQIIQTGFKYKTPESLSALGNKNGYQHLYLEATGNTEATEKAQIDSTHFTWMANNKFYTLTTATQKDDEILLARMGANDPNFNLRKDPSIILRRPKAKDTLFASIIEPHGSYNPVTESAHNANSNIAELSVVADNADYTAVSIKTTHGETRLFILSNNNTKESTAHSLVIDGNNYSWTGPYHYIAL